MICVELKATGNTVHKFLPSALLQRTFTLHKSDHKMKPTVSVLPKLLSWISWWQQLPVNTEDWPSHPPSHGATDTFHGLYVRSQRENYVFEYLIAALVRIMICAELVITTDSIDHTFQAAMHCYMCLYSQPVTSCTAVAIDGEVLVSLLPDTRFSPSIATSKLQPACKLFWKHL